MSELGPGDVVDQRYRVVAQLGAGSMGVVFAVEHIELRQPFALKLLSAHLEGTPGIEARFLREARIAGALDDPRLVKVTDYGRIGARPYLIMELVDGESLRTAAAAMSPRERVEVVLELLQGLAAAHRAGLVHRDLKPDNVLVTSARRVKILDFGLARLEGLDDEVTTAEGVIFGTPRYMAPEQAVGDPVDYRVDIYAVGVVLFELLAGAPPFDASNPSDLLRLQVVEAPPPLVLKEDSSGLNLEVLQAVLDTAMAKDADRRYPSAKAMTEGLRRALASPGDLGEASRKLQAEFRSWMERSAPWRKRVRTAYARLGPRGRGATAGVLAGGLAAIVLWPGSKETLKVVPPPQPAPALRGEELPAPLGAGAAVSVLDQLAGGRSDALQQLTGALTATATRLTVDEAQSWVRRGDRDRIRRVVTAVRRAEPQPGEAPAFLLALAYDAPSFALRREAYEALEHHGWDTRLDRLEYLSDQLRRNGTDKCSIRRWYVERLIALENVEARRLLVAERNRRGGFLKLERVNGCLRADIDAALSGLDGP